MNDLCPNQSSNTGESRTNQHINKVNEGLSEAIKVVEDASHLQHLLINLDDVSYAETYNFVNENYVDSTEKRIILLQSTENAFLVRFEKHSIYFRFMHDILPKIQCDQSLTSKLLFFEISDSFFFRNVLIKLNLIHIDEIIHIFLNNPQQYKNIHDEVKKLCFADYMTTEQKNTHIKNSQKNQNFNHIEENNDYLNDNENFKKLREEGVNHHKIAEIIRSDDVGFLKTYLNQNIKRFPRGYKSIIPYSAAEGFDFLREKQCTLIGYAAFYKAEKVFFFLENHLKKVSPSEIELAIAGGNMNIVNYIFKKYDIDQNNIRTYLKTAIAFFHDNIVDILRPIWNQKMIFDSYNNNAKYFLEYFNSNETTDFLCDDIYEISYSPSYLVKVFLMKYSQCLQPHHLKHLAVFAHDNDKTTNVKIIETYCVT
ncbi:hypothetical protein TRFO_41604 [Tritrichomonas foetus]|uniref:DUF3447 domain-containing protein n=1 Tax=Tritrichomonas foetus TaxID=1144522 RepID=A0A1J4KZR9_9EUKA|nr:hypothetical protein TRFO_41604 [Tritrichomonas foetus]|eukprot:OHT16753.1 hypothetical protein TRFO_41604 [Tritrichomonas foetus]